MNLNLDTLRHLSSEFELRCRAEVDKLAEWPRITTAESSADEWNAIRYFTPRITGPMTGDTPRINRWVRWPLWRPDFEGDVREEAARRNRIARERLTAERAR